MEAPDNGKINHGDTVVFGNFSQDGLMYKEDKRAIEYVKDMAEYFPLADGTKLSASMFMEKFGFNAQQQFTPLSKLSGGEKRRLHLMSVLFLNPNFLILDEPTNDLDLPTLGVLENFLSEFQGCLLIVSHDRYFMDRLVDHLFVFEGGGEIRDFPGNYSLYREWLKTNEKKADKWSALESKKSEGEATDTVAAGKTSIATGNDKHALADKQQAVTGKKAGFKEKREFEILEKDIKALEAEKSALETSLSKLPFGEIAEASIKIGQLTTLLADKEMRWLELSEMM